MELPVNESHDANTDDIRLLLDERRFDEVQQFRNALLSCKNEEERYELCEKKRDELLDAQSLIQIQCVCYEPEFSNSTTYKARRKLDVRWQEFTNIAAGGSVQREEICKRLKSPEKRWGKELVYHYAKGRGLRFVTYFAALANEHPNWNDQALPRLQQLVYRRFQLSMLPGRPKFFPSLETTDLKNARKWTANTPFVKENDPENMGLPCEPLRQLPEGYEFDQFGLFVRKVIGPGSNDILSIPVLHSDDMTADDTSATAYSESENGANKEDTDSTNGSKSLAVEDSIQAERTLAASNADGQGGATLSQNRDQAEDLGPNYGAISSLSGDKSCPTSSNAPLRRSHRQPLPQRSTGLPGIQIATHSGINRKIRSHATETSQTASLPLHKERLKILAGKLSALITSDLAESIGVPPASSKRRRAASLPADNSSNASKKHRATGPYPSLAHNYDHTACPEYNRKSDEAYLSEVIFQRRQVAEKESTSRGSQTARCLLPILENCQHPTTGKKDGLNELLVLDRSQAETLLGNTTPDIPLITEGQDALWKNPDKPTREFLAWFDDDDREVSVQIPSLKAGGRSYELRAWGQVRERFLSPKESDDPWNILDCRCPLPSTLPSFLKERNCQLLAELRDEVLCGKNIGRVAASSEDWVVWKELEKWALLAEGGHCTAPHMDSYGLATWITVQEGLFGFAWMSHPTAEQCEKWMENIEYYDETQRWRYWILKPGQTIFFPSGTIHCVFRTRQSNTFALGGHILQWSGVEKWIDVVSKQANSPDSTNEDMEDSWKWVSVIKDLVETRLRRSGTVI